MLRRILCAVFSLNFIFCGVSTFVYASSQGDLSKCELSGICKKNWSQRLKWFESRIIDYYKNLSKQNVLIVGDQNFLDLFKVYYNDKQPLKEYYIYNEKYETKKIIVSSETKSFYYLLEKEKNLKDNMNEIVEKNYINKRELNGLDRLVINKKNI